MAKSILEKLKDQDTLSREDIARLLRKIGKPGEKQEEKRKAVLELDHRNIQGFHIAETLNTYKEW